jgi:hypothetical protein
MIRRRLVYLAVAIASLGFAACSADVTGPDLRPELSADSASSCSRAIVSGGSTRC